MALRIKAWHLRGWCWTLMFTITWATSVSAFAQGQRAKAELESVLKDWQSRQSILKSARYVITGETEFKDKQLPAGNPIRPRRCVFLLDLARKRYRLEASEDVINVNGKDEDPKAWEYRTLLSTSAYDGKALQKYRHKRFNRINDDLYDLSITKGNLGSGAFLGPEVSPLFMAHGIVPTVHAPLLVDKWPLTHDPDDFDVAGEQLLHGQKCLLVRTEPRAYMLPASDEFWIHSQQKSAIHRYVCFVGSNPGERIDISWKNTAYGWWVDRWSKTWTDEGNVRRVYRFRVESFEADPEVSDGDFALPAEPGMKVIVGEFPPPGRGLDPFKAASRTYLISATGSWDEVAAEGYTTREGKALPPESRRGWIAWTIGGGLSLAALLLCVLNRRRKKAPL